MKLTRISLTVGLEKPLRVLHLSDTHVILADGRDHERKRALAAKRIHDFGVSMETVVRQFDEALAYGREHCDLIVHTGDVIDFVTWAGLAFMRDRLLRNDVFFAVGNHEFSQYVGEAKEDEAYKLQSYGAVQAASPNGLEVASRLVGGVNFVAVDNNYYWFTAQQLVRVKEEVAKGFPVILLMHNPIYTPRLYEHMMQVRKQPCAYLVGTPEEKIQCYPPDRREQQRADDATLAFIDWLKAQSGIRAVLAGHLHFPWQDQLADCLPQLIAGGGFMDEATELELV